MSKSPSEHLFSNLSWQSLRKSKTLLRNLGFLLVAFIALRLGSFIPLPGVDLALWHEIFSKTPFAH